MTIDDVMLIAEAYHDDADSFGTGLKQAIEQYAKDASEEMRKKCIAAVSSEKQFDYAYNDAINDAIKAIEEIK